jgi:hypothetical protein
MSKPDRHASLKLPARGGFFSASSRRGAGGYEVPLDSDAARDALAGPDPQAAE